MIWILASLVGRQVIRSNATRNFHQLQSLLLTFANPDKDGRIILSVERSTPVPKVTSTSTSHSPPVVNKPAAITIRYLLLNPAEVFREVVDDARSIIFAGGTMTPVRSLPQSS
jgi:chromosome transmission fidelity protein 1